eukprot:GHVU01113412.1.p1 GENE.GHVU01113412.1~~GHVU01113412.1.p1  ORF type:complete len:181 (-),score=23.89 GHVU01113412.1:114-656(-)
MTTGQRPIVRGSSVGSGLGEFSAVHPPLASRCFFAQAFKSGPTAFRGSRPPSPPVAAAPPTRTETKAKTKAKTKDKAENDAVSRLETAGTGTERQRPVAAAVARRSRRTATTRGEQLGGRTHFPVLGAAAAHSLGGAKQESKYRSTLTHPKPVLRRPATSSTVTVVNIDACLPVAAAPYR